MKRPNPPTSQLVSKLSTMQAADVAAFSRLSAADTTSDEFGKVFKENPSAALAAKGIFIDDTQAKKISESMREFTNPANSSLNKTEVEFSVKVKF